MAVNFSREVYLPTQDLFAVPCTFYPVFSQPDGSSYTGRGIYDTRQLDVMAADGSIYSDQQTIFDIRTAEYAVLPQQKDRVTIPYDCNGVPLGDFEIVDTDLNGGGEMTLTLRKWVGEPIETLQQVIRTGRREER
jgi:hypothetical protein